ncbi:MAG: acyl-CoA dehydrogenase family protein [Burkholderiales bacterium]|nr:acyl-CoA dehydrogenase family protein [Burkholderiales bacterium]
MVDLGFKRTLFRPEHEAFRSQVRRFIAAEIVPNHAHWDAEQEVPRELWRKAGALGMLGCTVPEEYGGPGGDWLHDVIVLEELAAAHAPGPGFPVHTEMAMPYVSNFASEALKKTWLPKLVAGEAIAGVAMTEPDAGSDLHAIRTRAARTAHGYALSGQKVFITNGCCADVLVVAAKLADSSRAISLFLLETKSPGFKRGRKLDKLGNRARDTAELFFDGVEIPAGNLIGVEGEGFGYLMQGLARERLAICVTCQARAEAVLRDTVAYVEERHVFGRALSTYQNTRFCLAQVKTEVAVGRVFVDRMIESYLAGELDGSTAAMGKLWLSEMVGRAADACLQLHGGAGYMSETAAGRAYIDSRAERIAGGTSEIMKEVIARTVFPGSAGRERRR